MTDREKLIDLLMDFRIVETIGKHVDMRGAMEQCADHLLAHGVTVREQQKPMDLVDAIEADDPVWIEYSFTFEYMEVIKIYPIEYFNRHFFADGTLIAERIKGKSILLQKDEYGKTWRCWAEKPTEEERKVAEWGQ